MDYLAARWGGVPLAATAAKVFLWSGCRKSEVAGLTWDSLRLVGNERHFEIIGKWGVERWVRLPEAVYEELLSFRTSSPFVFAAYTEQLRQFHVHHPNLTKLLEGRVQPKKVWRVVLPASRGVVKDRRQGTGVRSHFSQDGLATRTARRGHSPSDRQRCKSERVRPHDQLRQGNGRRNAAAKQPHLPAYSSQPLPGSGRSLR